MANLPSRAEIPREETWAIEHLFATQADVDAAIADIDARVAALAARAGSLATHAGDLLRTLEALETLQVAINRVRMAQTLPLTTEAHDPAARAAAGRFHALASGWRAALAFVEPELLRQPAERLRELVAQDPAMARFAAYLSRLEERRPHVRSPEVERVLAGAAGVFGAFGRIRDALAEGNLRFPSVPAADGERELAPSTYRALLADPDRAVRRAAFERWTDTYLGVGDTLAEAYLANVRRTAFEAEARAYPSGEAAALAGHRVPVAVLDATLAAFERRMPIWHRYFAARRRLLRLDRLRPWDVFAPSPLPETPLPYEQAAEWIATSSAPLGADVAERLRQGMGAGRWVDRRPNRGKRQGAFCDAVPGVHPFVFVSYVDDLASASTLAHEMGHALHAEWAADHITPLDAGWQAISMTVAETASNAQQALLRTHLMREAQKRGPDFELEVLDEAFGNVHRYLMVMPTLVRFEREVHAGVARGVGYTAADLTALTARLFAEAYGPEVTADWDDAMRARVGIAWAEFTHLYAPFYTFQYTVGIAVALALVERIASGGDAGAYLDFLAAGGSVPPVDAFARLGFDVTTPAPVDAAFDVLEGFVERLERHADRLGG